jgi:hypothetical protein
MSSYGNLGTWTVGSTVTNQTPVPVSVTPSSGTGTSQTFSTVVSDANGYTDINTVYFLIDKSVNGVSACFILYSRSSGTFRLASDTGASWSAGITPGVSGSASNSQCTLSGTGSAVSGSGNNLTLQLALSFTSTFTGTRNVYVAAIDQSSAMSSYGNLGTWTVP